MVNQKRDTNQNWNYTTITMTRKVIKSVAILAVLYSSIITVYAQKSTSSPYSIYGYGVLANKEDAVSAGMGHSGVALAPSTWLNTKNPAAYSNLDSLSFYFNLQFKAYYGHQEAEKYSQSTYSGNIDAVAMGFRVTRWWGAGLGFSPYSHIGYTIDEVKYILGNDSQYSVTHEGYGGLSQAYINNSFTLFKHLTLGVSVSAVWGSINRKETALISGGESMYNLKKYTVNNLFFEYGFQYGFNVGKTELRIGGVYNDKRYLAASYDQSVSNDVDGALFHDDETRIEDFYVPRAFSAGLSAERGRWTMAVDYKFNQWSEVKNAKATEAVKFRDCWSVGGGIHY